MKIKSLFKSKTVWVNALTFVAGAIVFAQEHDLITDNPEAVAIAGGVLALVNLALRFVTDSAVAVNPPKAE
jgi:hypothetical protein